MSLPLSSSQVLNRAYIILLFSSLVLLYAGLTTFGCLGIHREEGKSKIVQLICEDTHYRYLLPLLIPSGAYYVIANWVGWEYFRYA
ncbi:hypothetical protein BDY24DRAFT_374580 [Mrakia frigida]|uniref:PIG-Y family protein n=1 Tax=Mrakia frigida TaxID=29902 RepID=UPI003FCC019F